MLRASEVEFQEAEGVDHVEAGSGEGGHRWGKQCPGANRARSVVASVGEPVFHVVPVGDHVVVEQHHMGDVGLVRPPADTGPHGMLRGGGRHGPEGTRSESSAGLTALPPS